MKLTFTIPGKPFGKQNMEPAGRNNSYAKGSLKLPTKSKDEMNHIAWTFKQAYPQHKLLQGQIKLSIDAYYYIAKHTTKKLKQQMQENQILPTKKPDITNVVKLVEDALNDVAWIDDSHVVHQINRKFYSDTPRVEVTIEEI